jgi:4-hydroxybenzoate polyprenyltransferase
MIILVFSYIIIGYFLNIYAEFGYILISVLTFYEHPFLFRHSNYDNMIL